MKKPTNRPNAELLRPVQGGPARRPLFKDPLGALDPWIEDPSVGRSPDVVTLEITAGLFLVTGGSHFRTG
ncbi:hypothetical protein [Streptomyces sp. NPDC001978]|uniref:hypothetical protein n=1 Tax=Streptomyces sp. NPDC001978 TaxID=3364627 RepID=UPI0036989916